MRIATYITCTLLIVTIIGGCLLPRVSGDGKISPDETEFVANIPRYAQRLIDAKGWATPEADPGEMWLKLAFWFTVGSAVACVAWWMSHLRELGGVAMILGAFAVCCAGLAQIDWLWLLPGIGILLVLAWVGYRLKDWNILKPIKERLAKCQKS